MPSSHHTGLNETIMRLQRLWTQRLSQAKRQATTDPSTPNTPPPPRPPTPHRKTKHKKAAAQGFAFMTPCRLKTRLCSSNKMWCCSEGDYLTCRVFQGYSLAHYSMQMFLAFEALPRSKVKSKVSQNAPVCPPGTGQNELLKGTAAATQSLATTCTNRLRFMGADPIQAQPIFGICFLSVLGPLPFYGDCLGFRLKGTEQLV